MAYEATRERVAWVLREIERLEGLIGDWSTRVPDGTPAPPQALALMVEKEKLATELHTIAGLLEPVAPRGPSLLRKLLDRLAGRRAK